MPLARSFTKRFARGDKHAHQQKPQISLPTELVSTSNDRCYDALDLSDAQLQHSLQPFMPPEFPAFSSANSGYHTPLQPASDVSGYATPSAYPSAVPSTPEEHCAPDLTDASSPEQNSPVQPAPDGYFGRSKTVREVSSKSSLSHDMASPAIPTRAASHSKREHERMAHRRSVRSSLGSTVPSLDNASHSSRSSSGPTTPRDVHTPEPEVPSQEWRSSTDIIGRSGSINEKTRGQKTDRHNPFSNELEQLNEVVEEFTQLSRDVDAEMLATYGLAKYSADDYLSEMGGLYSPFTQQQSALVNTGGSTQGWI